MRTLTLLLAALLPLCSQAEIQLRDDSGQTVHLKAPAKRIVSLAPHLTENLFAAGAGAVLVGAVDYSDYPPAAKSLPRVGGYSRLDLEAIVALKPDLVVGWQSGNAPAALERLKALGIPVFVSQTNRIEDIAPLLEQLGTLSGNSTSASKAANSFRQRLASLRQQYSQRPPVWVFYQVWKAPLTTVGGPQIISDAIRVCGGVNVFGQLKQMAPHVSTEAVLAANPDAIIASGMGESRPQWLDDWRQWTTLVAVKQNALFHIPPDLIQRHTPRLLDGTERLCQQLEQVREGRKTR
jgi:iron complex transport system substrate-binding protein